MKILSTTVILLGLSYSHAKGIRQRRLQVSADNDGPYDVTEGDENRLEVSAPGILGNDSADQPIKVEGWSGSLEGDLRVNSDGSFRYKTRLGFTGTEQFTYEACYVDDDSVCDSATVTIRVNEDPNRPDGPPSLGSWSFSVFEGQTLDVSRPGILGSNSQGLYVYDTDRDSGFEGSLDADSDGSFEYEAPGCWTGFDSFTYEVCYSDYPDLCSEDRVTIEVLRDSNRPDPADVQNDEYDVREGEWLEVSASGILSNDRPSRSQRLYVYDEDEDSGFEGDLDVHSDGSFEYFPEPGVLGSFSFTYEACYTEWSCVDCREARVTINVLTNPNKPDSPPSPQNDAYSVTQGEDLDISSPGVLDNDQYDSRYTLHIDWWDYVGDFDGSLDVDSDGSFDYEPEDGFVGTETFYYTVCYEEWPDLCADGTVTLTTNAPSPPEPDGARQGIAAAYEIRWAAPDENGCEEVEPSLSLACDAGGVLSLLDVGSNDNSLCSSDPVLPGVITCSAERDGIIYAECRDLQLNDDNKRRIIVSMHSEPVSCVGSDSPPFWTYQMMSLHTWCTDAWVKKDITCSGTILDDGTGTGGTICMGDSVTFTSPAQPPDLQMNSTSFMECPYI